MGESIINQDYLEQQMHLEEKDLRQYSPLVLAYIGDAVFELIIRTIMVRQDNSPVQKLHKRTSTLVKAENQADMMERMMKHLTEEEESVYRRGRNAKSCTKAKNASTGTYRKATGFEALIGYLYLQKKMDRIVDLVKIGLEGEDFKRVDAHNHHGEHRESQEKKG